jgi:CHAT domain-containing protein/tetratricopeptide (TPR) repeat protein
MEDREEAIAIYRQAVDANPPGLRQQAVCLGALAVTLHDRYEHTGKIEDLDEAVTILQKALDVSRTWDPGLALTYAQNLGGWAFQRLAWQEAVDAFGEAMSIVDALCEVQLLRSDKHNLLSSAQVLYAAAAYSMARLGDLRGAVLAMETGRARVLTEMLDRTRADLDAVEKQAPELVHRYRGMLAQLRHAEEKAASGAIAQTHEQPEHDRSFPKQLREARAELQAAIEAIRATPGHGSFLARPSVPTLLSALEPGVPTIYLAATPMGGLALVVSNAAGTLDVTPLWLDSLTSKAVYEMVRGVEDELAPGNWLGDYIQWQTHQDDRRASVTWHKRIEQTTRALWDITMGPVLALLKDRFPGSERAVLIPNGLLALLPLHAAWTEDTNSKPHWALDDIAFHYAPSVCAFGHARDIASQCGQTKLLVIDDPKPSSASPLPNSKHEVEAAAAHFASDDVTILSGESCQHDDVLRAIAGAHICHFSCHGTNDRLNPLKSGLQMSNDQRLSVEDLLALPGKQARMAVLSACETGIVGTDAPNEIVALPAAFLQAGFACVVASLWSVFDISSSLLMAKFYELWLGAHLTPAVALCRAQIWLRDMKNHELVAHLEQLVPELVPRGPAESVEVLHFRALVQDPNACSFANPVHWAAFYLTGV